LVELGEGGASLAEALIASVALLDLTALILRDVRAGVDALVAGVENGALVELATGAAARGLATPAPLANEAAADERPALGEEQLKLLAALLVVAGEGLPEAGRILLGGGPGHLMCIVLILHTR
jgi:hypothetical protein